ENQPHGGLTGKKAVTEVQLHRLGQEDGVLLPKRPVQPLRATDGLALEIRGLRAGHHEHRIPDHVERCENQRRHDQDNQCRLKDTADNGGYHARLLSVWTSCPGPGSIDRRGHRSGRRSSWPRPTSRTAAAGCRNLPSPYRWPAAAVERACRRRASWRLPARACPLPDWNTCSSSWCPSRDPAAWSRPAN